MPILLRNIRLNLDESEDLLPELIASRLSVPSDLIRSYAVVRRSLDARKKADIHFAYHVEVALDETSKDERARLQRLKPQQAKWIEPEPRRLPRFGRDPLPGRPVIVGFGPGGMFAAIRLAELGYKPIVFERGREVRKRHRDVMQRYYKDVDFDPTSNLLYGEGGAGTYSDGKLYTRVNDPLVRTVLETLFHHGADPDVLINARPHVGSDRLPTICARIRRKIESLGGEVRFEQCIDDIRLKTLPIKTGKLGQPSMYLTQLHVNGPQLPEGGEWIDAGPSIFATGHSARDTLRLMKRCGIMLVSKPFQMGVRIEHPQSMVDRWQYGPAAGHQRLGPAEYHLVARDVTEESDMFSFCMCPGGMILPSNESPGIIATNGASRANRSGPFANSGLVITLNPESLRMGPLECLSYQQKWETLAFEATRGSYKVPAQRACDFLAGSRSDGELESSFPLGAQWADMASIIPHAVTEALHRALPFLDSKLRGYAGSNGVITGPETRASGPVRIPRDPKTRCAQSVDLLYPVGEGAGYAGGIISSAVDGIKSADAIIGRFAPN